MYAAEKYTLCDQTLWLSAARCIFWEDVGALVLSDLHFGKTGHFRKSGIGVPQSVFKEDLQRLVDLVRFYRVQQVIVVGDFFHSTMNRELELFAKWRNDLATVPIHLVRGNHDILPAGWYKENDIEVSEHQLQMGPFCFVHDMADACMSPEIAYHFSGHLHPYVSLRGAGKQTLHLACYHFRKHYAVLPAFSRFTGKAIIEREATDTVFAILPGNMNRQEPAAVIRL